MSSIFDVGVATLHNDCDVGQTKASMPNYTLSPSFLENLSKDDCLCTLKEVLFHLKLKKIDISRCSKESQVQFLTRLMSERFHSTCFTEALNICIKCSLSPDLEVSISNGNVEELKECASKLINGAGQIPDNKKLHLACLAKDHQRVHDLLKEAQTDLEEKNMFIFYGISCGEIVDILVNSGVDVNTRDARRRTPLFYALTSSPDSAKKLLDNGASVTKRDNCQVSVLTFFADNMFKNHLPADVKDEGLKLLSERFKKSKIIKALINLTLCKFIQVSGTMQPASNPQGNDLNPKMLCETLKMFLGDTHDGTQFDGHNNLISQLQESTDTGNFDVFKLIQSFDELGADPSAPDSDGNTSLHYATQLLFYGVPEETVTDLCRNLMKMKHDVRLDAKNHKKETPLLFCLSSRRLIASKESGNWHGCLRKVCGVLVEKGSKLRHTNHKEESAFHLILKICQNAILLQDEDQKRSIVEEMLEILSSFKAEKSQWKYAIRKRDVHLNTPLHLLASLAPRYPDLYNEDVYAGQSFENLLKKIFELLLESKESKVMANESNRNKETPLHMCRTWTAVKLLRAADAEPDVADSSGCTPLLAAAKRNTCIKEDSELFYPDVTQTPKEFWKEVLDMKFYPWTSDRKGNSVLSILIQKQANCLAKALIEVACELQGVQSDEVGAPLLIAVCRDKSSENHWKLDLVKLLVDSRRSLVRSTVKDNNDTPLHFSCRNILELREPSVEDSVHWKIAQYLLLCGADVNAAGEAGESCLALSDNCPALKDLLSTPVDHSTLPLVLGNWKQSSQSHYQQLSLVARKVKYQQVKNLYLYTDHLDEINNSGSFVFAGIDQGGREVAVKRIDNSKMLHGNGEESVLITSRWNKVIPFLFCEQDENFRYIAFELMEGDLEHYLDHATVADDSNMLCEDLVMGLQFLQSHGIVHGNINPRTVFYHTKPNLCLKIGNCKTSSLRRGWVAAEVLNGGPPTNKSDVFSCGLVLHYLLSGKRHPFAPADSATKSRKEVLNETDQNIVNGNNVKMDDSLSPEATDLVPQTLNADPSNRPSAADALKHPFCWDKKTKNEFLLTLGNEPEFEMVQLPLTKFEDELEGKFSRIVSRSSQWNDPSTYDQISETHEGIPKGKKKNYDFKSVAHLLRFIRNRYRHINDHDAKIQGWLNNYFIFDDNNFPCLVMEVYNTVKAYNLHTSRPQIEIFLSGAVDTTYQRIKSRS